MDEDQFISDINHAIVDYEDGNVLFEELVYALENLVKQMKKEI